jgi:hypothetical protein
MEQNTEFLKKFEEMHDQVQEKRNELKSEEQKRIDWCRKNSKAIKKWLPKRNEIFKIKPNIKVAYWTENARYVNSYEEVLYFKIRQEIFNPSRIFDYGNVYPTVKGEILDCNFKPIKHYNDSLWFEEISIVELEEVDQEQLVISRKKRTNVYVMIDKNTGYYKIGRSVRPEYREKTLQSEKPTIEMLFYYDAKVKDEKELHEKFQSKRIRGEWFDLSGSDLTSIREYFEQQ